MTMLVLIGELPVGILIRKIIVEITSGTIRIHTIYNIVIIVEKRRVDLNILDSIYYLGYIFGAGTET